MIRRYLQILVALSAMLLPSVLPAQDVVGAYTRYSDSFREWIIRTYDEQRYGTLEMRWKINNDWSVWDFRMGDTIAEIRLKWKDDPNLWEIRCLDEIVTARTLWNNGFFEWRLDDGTDRLVWQSRYGNVWDEWIVRDTDRGEFSVYTYWQRDPREWVVYDNLDEDVSYAMRISMIFLALFHSTPRI